MVLADLVSDIGWKLLLIATAAELSLIGVIAVVWGLFRLRRTRFRPQAYQRLLRELIRWRMLEEDLTGEYPHAEPLVVLWAHLQGFAAITIGCGIVVAGLLASIAVLLAPVGRGAADIWSARHAAPQQFVVFFLVYVQLFVLGMAGGLILGYARAFRWSVPHPDPAGSTWPPRGEMQGAGLQETGGGRVDAYRAWWLPWLVLAVIGLQTALFALALPAAFWHAPAALLAVLLVVPGLAVSEVVILEGITRALCRMPLVALALLPDLPPEAADQQRAGFYAFLVTVFACLQVGMLPFAAVSQVLAWLAFMPSIPHAVPAALWGVVFVDTFGSMVLIGFLGKTGGRLGGSGTGWPWRPVLDRGTA